MKKIVLLCGLALGLAACNNESEEAHETQSEDSHHHEHVLDMEVKLDNEADPSVISIQLSNDGEPYEADRVRFEVVDEAAEEIVWVNAGAEETGLYTAELQDIEPGEYKIVSHINGPDELHEHTEEVFEVK